jgi:hypothetical protein
MRKPLDILYNFHWVVPGEAGRAAQAYIGMLGAFLRGNQIAGLINLRGRNPKYSWWRNETKVCAAMGVVHLDAMLDSRKLPTRAMLAGLFEAFDGVPKPFIVKCSGGQDRTSLASALYLIHRDGWGAMDAARAQFARFPYLHFPKRHQRWLKMFLDYAKLASGELPIAQWVREFYEPQALADWLDANGQRDTYKEIFTRPEASRWQW